MPGLRRSLQLPMDAKFLGVALAACRRGTIGIGRHSGLTLPLESFKVKVQLVHSARLALEV